MSAILEFIKIMQDWQHREEAESHSSPLFCVRYEKDKRDTKKKRVSKEKLLKFHQG